MPLRLSLFIFALASSSACIGSPGGEPPIDDGDDDRDLEQRPLCASCEAVVGGETGDLGSDSLPPKCRDKLEAIDLDDSSLGFAPRDVLAYVEGEHEAPMHWRQAPEASEHEPTTGFDEDTTLRLEVRNAEVSRARSTPVGNTPESQCKDYLAIDVDITLSTADGAVSGVMDDVRLRARAGHVAQGAATRSIAAFTGTLDLHPDEARPHDGWMSIDLWLREGSLRGTLRPLLGYADEGNSSEGRHVHLINTHEAQWPADECTPGLLPVAGDVRTPGPDGRKLGEILDEARARVGAANPLAGRDADAGSDTDVEIEVGDVVATCLNDQAPEGGTIVGKTVARIATADERLELEEEVSLELNVDPSGTLRHVTVQLESELVPAADFKERYGYADSSFGTWECGQLRLRAHYGLVRIINLRAGTDTYTQTAAFAAGGVEVDGTLCPGDDFDAALLEYTSWCNTSPCPLRLGPVF